MVPGSGLFAGNPLSGFSTSSAYGTFSSRRRRMVQDSGLFAGKPPLTDAVYR